MLPSKKNTFYLDNTIRKKVDKVIGENEDHEEEQ